MRDGPWKMLAKINGGKFPKLQNVNSRNIERVRGARLTDFELYRVTNDIGESKNIIDQHPQQAEKLKKRLSDLYRELAETAHHWKVKRAK